MTRYYQRCLAADVDRLVADGWRIAGATRFSLDDIGVTMWIDAGEMDSVQAAEWRDQWVASWAAIGWAASTDVLQTQITIALSRLADAVRQSVREITQTIDNMHVRMEWIAKVSRR